MFYSTRFTHYYVLGKTIRKSTAQALEGVPGQHIITMTPNNIPSINDICLTEGCIHAASNILGALDSSVEPCDDFYNFACGNFIKETQIPDEKVAVTAFSIIGDKLQEQLRVLIGEDAEPNESEPFKLAKDLFRACMNKSLIEERGLQPVINITDKLGGWPVIVGDRWDEQSSWTWIQAVKDFRKVGYSMDYIFDFSIGSDMKHSLRRTIDVSVFLIV